MLNTLATALGIATLNVKFYARISVECRYIFKVHVGPPPTFEHSFNGSVLLACLNLKRVFPETPVSIFLSSQFGRFFLIPFLYLHIYRELVWDVFMLKS